MNEHLNPERERLSSTEYDIEKALRPQAFEDFTGQQKILANLKAQMDALDSIIEQIQKLGGKALELWIDAWKTAFS